jgi:hypothetical protein
MPYIPPTGVWQVLDEMRRRLLTDIAASEAALKVAESPAEAQTHPATPTPPPRPVYGTHSPGNGLAGSHTAPPIPPSDLARVRTAASIARTAYPDPIGDIVYRDLIGWCDHAGRFGGHARYLAAAQVLEQWADQKRVTFG